MILSPIGFFAGRRMQRRRSLASAGIFGLSLLALVASAGWALDDAKPEEAAGLRGILPAEVPADLSADAFAALGGQWQEWSSGAAQAAARLYDPDVKDIAGQRQVIRTLRAKLDVMRRALADQRYRPLFDPLTELNGSLLRRVDMAEAILDTLQIDPAQAHAARLADSRRELDAALTDLNAYLKPMKNGDAWLAYVRAPELQKLVADSAPVQSSLPVLSTVHGKLQAEKLSSDVQRRFLGGSQFQALGRAIDRYVDVANAASTPPDNAAMRAELANLVAALERHEAEQSSASASAARKSFNALRDTIPDGGARISSALQEHYFNYNLRVVASETFLNRLIAEERVDRGPVHDFILGARVGGNQVTNTKVGVDLKPSGNSARFDITVAGDVQSSTAGVTEQATIYTSGYHRFNAAKQIDFDGDQFTTKPARINVDANNTTVGATTNYSRLPILGGIANRVAMDQAQKKRPQSEAIAASRVSDRVLPELNRDVDKQFADLNARIGPELEEPLKELGLYPSAKSYRSTDDEMWMSARIMTLGELGGSAPNWTVASSKGIALHLHETLLNNAIDRMEIAGQTLTDKELEAKFAESLATLLKRPVSLSSEKNEGEPAKETTTFIFAESDPIRVRAANGTLTLILRTGLKQEEGEEDIPTQVITVPLTLRIEGDSIVTERGTVGVAPAERPRSLPKQIVFAGVARKKIESAIPTSERKRHFDLKPEGKKPIDLAVTAIRSVDGWLSIAIE